MYDFSLLTDHTFWADGVLVHNCGPCAMVDGTEWPTLAEAMKRYPSGGYSECEGGSRCRGTVVAIYAEL